MNTKLRSNLFVAAVIVTTFAAGAAYAAAPARTETGPALTGVAVFPKQVNLSNQRDRQSFVVQATWSDGITRDVSGEAKIKLADDSLAKLDGNTLHPAKDGKTTLAIEYGGRTLELPVAVTNAKTERPISFRLDVVPVFTKAGCNTGSCHGAARGKDGFHMSLFGYDPAGDYFKLTRQLVGRRINLAIPHESLLLTKATGAVQHTGGEQFKPDSELYATLLRWIEAGAPNDSEDVAKVTGIELMPPNAVLDGEGATQRVTVLAKYSDGTDRDVTSLAAFFTSNEASATISEDGLITAGQRGEAFIMARFDAYTVGVPVIVLPKGLKYDAPNVPTNNYIDELVNDKLKKLRIIPADLCTDEVFVRRAYIDLIGQLPSPETAESFVADKDPKKREKLIDRLIERPEFSDIWVMKFSELLQVASDRNVNRGLDYKGTLLYYNWLRGEFLANTPMDQIVKQILTASGSMFENPAASFYQVERDNLKLAENVAQVFMGMRIQCAQCHNHPFDRWTMDDYYGFAAFFAQIGRKRGDDPREYIYYNRGSGDTRHLVDNRVVEPKFLGGIEPEIPRGGDRREVLAKWLASPENPYFATNLANIVWAHFFGKGIVDPVDDVRVSNPPSNAPLLDELGNRFTSYDYDFRRLVRDICNSRTYQLSTATNPTNELDERNFSRAYVRRMRAEVLFDCISQVTQTADQNKFPGLPQGARAVQIHDGRTSTYFLTTFGRSTRESVCSCEVKMEPNLSQALHLLNGDTVHEKISRGDLVEQLIAKKMTNEQIVEELYVRCLSRKPTQEEMAEILKAIGDTDPQQPLEDLFWALLNSKEFLFNH